MLSHLYSVVFHASQHDILGLLVGETAVLLLCTCVDRSTPPRLSLCVSVIDGKGSSSCLGTKRHEKHISPRANPSID